MLPYQNNLNQIPVWSFRSLYFALLQYLIFGRGEDLIKLRAGQIEKCTDQWDGTALRVTFYDTKTTQKGLPQTTCIMQAPEESEICPVKISDMYFERLGFQYGGSEVHDHNWLFPSTYYSLFSSEFIFGWIQKSYNLSRINEFSFLFLKNMKE